MAIYIGKENYVTRSASLSLAIEPRIVQAKLGTEISEKRVEKPEGNKITLQFNFTDPVTGGPLTNAIVTMTYRGKTYNLTETSPGVYEYTIDTSKGDYQALISADNDYAIIHVSKANYTMDDIEVFVSVTPPEFTIGSFGIQKIFVYIGGGVALIAIGVYGTARYIHYANIPLIVKQIDKTAKNIKGKKVLSDDRLTTTKEEEIVEKFGDYWELLDLDLAEILGIKEEGTKATPVTPGDTEAGGV